MFPTSRDFSVRKLPKEVRGHGEWGWRGMGVREEEDCGGDSGGWKRRGKRIFLFAFFGYYYFFNTVTK